MLFRLPPGPAMYPFLSPALVDDTLNDTFQILGNYVQAFTVFRGLGQPTCLSRGQRLQ